MRLIRILTAAAASAIVGAGMLALAAPAAAHVTVHSTDATQGGYAVLTFRVPTESASASTTKLQVHFPTDTPITSVDVQPQPGWSFHTTITTLPKPVTTRDGKVTKAVTEITWSADSADSAIKPGEFDQFLVSAGPLPHTDTLRFPAIQTYSDGSVVKWIETPAPGSTSEPDHPAPTLTLAAGDPAATTQPTHATGTGSTAGSTAALVLSIIAVILAAGTVAYIAVAHRKTRNRMG